MAVSAGVLISLSQLLDTLGKVSPLWQLNQFPDLTRNYSAFAGFAGSLEQFHLLALYWGVLSLAIALFTLRVWLSQDRLEPKTALAARAGFSCFSALVLVAAWLQWTLPAQCC